MTIYFISATTMNSLDKSIIISKKNSKIVTINIYDTLKQAKGNKARGNNIKLLSRI